jgi:hypothetical protein
LANIKTVWRTSNQLGEYQISLANIKSAWRTSNSLANIKSTWRMKKSERIGGESIDYLKFANTGEKVIKSHQIPEDQDLESIPSNLVDNTTNIGEGVSTTEEISSILDSSSFTNITMELEIKKLIQKQDTLNEDITDFIDENSVEDRSIEDLDVMISKMEKLRTNFRSTHKELQNLLEDEYEKKLMKQFDQTIRVIKTYIIDVQTSRKIIRREETARSKNKEKSKKRADKFMVAEIKMEMQHLLKEFSKTNEGISYEELLRRKAELSSNLKKTEAVAEIFKEILQSETSEDLEDVTETYHRLNDFKRSYTEQLWKSIEEQDVLKYENFSTTSLNIKLSIFTGYNSVIDIYTFQSDFEKIYKKSSPKDMLPDLLKNNYLSGPSLALVKDVENIEEIWRRLKASYGDPKLMLSKKLSNLGQTNLLYKTNDPEKLIDSISRVISSMRDLIKLAKDHKVEQQLYFGDGIERIYRILGDSRLTRWFADISEKDLAEEQLWYHLIKFLEKEVKVQQQN